MAEAVERTIGFRLMPQVQYAVSDQEGWRRLTLQIVGPVVVPLHYVNIRLVSTVKPQRFSDLRTPSGERRAAVVQAPI